MSDPREAHTNSGTLTTIAQQLQKGKVDTSQEQKGKGVCLDGLTNPYVGPRAFRTGEMLYGRDREAVRLLDLLFAERMVLLFSQSGAGKTSLIQAKLVPMLREESFQVLPPISFRASIELLGDHTRDLPITNRYRFATLLSLEGDRDLSPAQPLLFEELAGMSLQEYWNRRFPRSANTEDKSRILIFDQFEEVFSLDPVDQAAKKAFFQELGALLRDNRQLWALFAMREDYLGSLEPCLSLFPTRLRTRFRLDLLGPEAAAEAIQNPAQAYGVTFTDDAAAELVKNLCVVRVPRPDGTIEEKPGPHVEPVQLQVVCHYVWKKLSAHWRAQGNPAARIIELSDIQTVEEAGVREQAAGNVDHALAEYYSECVARAAGADMACERAIREWFEQRLIMAQGVRGLALVEPGQGAGLDDDILSVLESTHLIRKDRHGTAEFYELTHDRLIKPVQDSNARWREKHLSDLQKQAAFWKQEGEPERLLFTGPALAQAEEWARGNQDQLIAVDRDFLEESRTSQKQEREQRKKRLWMYSSALVFASLVALVVFTWLLARNSSLYSKQMEMGREHLFEINKITEDKNTKLKNFNDELRLRNEQLQRAVDTADEERKRADEERKRTNEESEKFKSATLVEKALAHKDSQLDLAFLLINKANESNPTPATRDGLRSLLLGYPFLQQFLHPCSSCSGDNQLIKKVAVEKKGTGIACLVGKDIILYCKDRAAGDWEVLPPGDGVQQVHDIGFRDGGPNFVWIGSNQKDFVYCRYDPIRDDIPAVIPLESIQGFPSVTLSPDGAKVAIANAREKEVVVWLIEENRKPFSIRLSLTGEEKTTSPAYSSVEKSGPPPPSGQPGLSKATVLAFSPSGKQLAVGMEDRPLFSSSSAVRKSYVLLWRNWKKRPGEQLRLTGTEGQVRCLAFSPDEETLVSGGDDLHVRFWENLPDLNSKEGNKAKFGYRSHTKPVQCLAFADNHTLISGSSDKTILLFYFVDKAGPREWLLGPRFKGHGDTVSTLANSPISKTVFSGSYDGKIILWDFDDRQPLRGDKDTGQHSAPVQGLAWSPDGKRLATGGYDGKIFLWDPATREPVAPALEAHTGKVQCVAFSPDGEQLASGAWEDGNLLLWHLKGGDKPLPVQFTTGLQSLQTLAFRPTGPEKFLALAGYSESDGGHYLQLWGIGKRSRTELSVLNASTVGLMGSLLGQGPLLSLSSLIPAESMKAEQKANANIWKLAWSRDGEYLAAASWDGTVTLWHVTRDGKLVQKGEPLKGGKGRVWGVAFHPSGKWLASSHSENMVILWELRNENFYPRYFLQGHSATVESIFFNESGTRLVSASWDGLLIVWDTSSLNNGPSQEPVPFLPALTGHRDEVWGVVFSPQHDAQLLASIGKDCQVILWDFEKILQQPTPPSQRVQEWLALSQKIANRDLSDSEMILFRDLRQSIFGPDQP